MSEALTHINSTETNTNSVESQERQSEKQEQEFTSLLNGVESLTPKQTKDLLEKVVNPEDLQSFQEQNSTRVIEMLKNTKNLDYFWIEQAEFLQVQNELKELNLDVNQVLEQYSKYIDTKLDWLNQIQKDKIKLVIKRKILKLWWDIKEQKYDLKSWEDFKKNRWIINSRLQENFAEINNKILPSAEILSQYNKWDKPSSRENWLYSLDDKIEEIQKMFNSEVLENWEFDKTWRSWEVIDANTNNWNVVDSTNRMDSRFLKEKWLKQVEWISLLSSEDKKIEEKAMLYFMAMIWVQIWVETIWWIPWTLVGWWVDLYDTFSKDEALLEILQGLNLVPDNYKMDKTALDNILAWIWIIPWMTQIVKGSKLADFMKKVDKKAFENAKNEIKAKLWIGEKIEENTIFRTYEYKDYTYKSPINHINELFKIWNLEKIKEILLSNSNKLYFPEWEYSLFKELILKKDYKQAFEIYKKAESESIKKLNNIWFTIEDNLKFYEALKNWDVNQIKKLLEKSKKISWDVYKWNYINTSDTYWISRNSIVNIKKYNEKQLMLNPISWKEELISRKELHELIINKFLNWLEQKDSPIFLVLWWMSWSWKSEIKKWLNIEIWNHIEVDPDAVRRLLPEFKENVPETSITTHQESLFISKQILDRSINNSSNILRETIMTRPEPLFNYIAKWEKTHKMDFRFVFSWEESWLRNTLWRDRTVNPQVYISQFKAFETVVDLMKNENIQNLQIILNIKEEEIIFNKTNWIIKPTSWEWMKKFFMFSDISKQINN